MRTCIICELQFDDSKFKFNDFICDRCFKRLKKKPNYNKDASRYVSVRMAYVLLLQAIREQAIADGELYDFEEYWLQLPVMKELKCIL